MRGREREGEGEGLRVERGGGAVFGGFALCSVRSLFHSVLCFFLMEISFRALAPLV